MGDPVTTGMIIGAIGGAATSKNPIEGAMMGGAMGAAGGSFAGGAMGASSGVGGGFAGGGYGSVGAAGAAPTLGQSIGSGFSALGSDIGAANKYLNQNPFTAQAGMSLAQSAFQPEQPMQMAPAGQVSRGQPQQVDYMSLLNPQQQTVARPQPFSLL